MLGYSAIRVAAVTCAAADSHGPRQGDCAQFRTCGRSPAKGVIPWNLVPNRSLRMFRASHCRSCDEVSGLIQRCGRDRSGRPVLLWLDQLVALT